LEVSSGLVDLYQSISGPSSFESGGLTSPSAGSGDRFGIRFAISSLAVPAGYVSGTSLAGTSTFTGKSFSQLGLVPGYYTWTWGSGVNADSIIIKVLDMPPPIQANIGINVNQNPVLHWKAELGYYYSISYSTDLKNYFSQIDSVQGTRMALEN
jgi:hypothetical protein